MIDQLVYNSRVECGNAYLQISQYIKINVISDQMYNTFLHIKR